jgi:hypothetical protein
MKNKIYCIFITLVIGAIFAGWRWNQRAEAKAEQRYIEGIEQSLIEMYGESIPSNGVAVPIEELTITAVPMPPYPENDHNEELTITAVPMPPYPENDHNITEELFQPVNRTLNLDNQEEIDWTFDTTEPNTLFASDPIDWIISTETPDLSLSTLTTTGDWTINTNSGHEIVFKTDGPDIIILGDPNYYGEALKTMLKCFIQQQESHAFWQKTNQKLLTDSLNLSREVARDTDKILKEVKGYVKTFDEQVIAAAAEIAEDVVLEIGENIKKELAVTE